MSTDIKNQQQNKSTCGKNNISRDIIFELQQAEKNLELANFIHQDFIKTISININKPCNDIFALSTVLYAREDEPNKKSAIAEIVTSAEDLMYYSRNIVNFATTSVVPVPTISGKFNPKTLVNNVINKLIPSSKCKGIGFANNFTNGIADIIIGDSYRLEAILTQLITNAIKFTEQGSVTLTTYFFPKGTAILQNDKDYNSRKTTEVQKAKDVLQFIVHDTGVGMSEAQQQYIYKQLNGLDGSAFTNDSTSKATGEELESNSNSESNLELGLGLSLVKQFIYEVNGKIDVSSRKAKSTTFTLQIPVISPSVKESRQ